jgi:Ni,Fe-hydrogenase III large subunit/Ni,Fe-hydrogenase III component G
MTNPAKPVAAALVNDVPSADVLAESDGLVRIGVDLDDLERAVHWLAGIAGSRFADLFAAGGSDETTVLHVLWALDEDGAYVMLESRIVGHEYPPLSDIAPAAFLEECETYEQYGLRPAGGKPLNRVSIPPQFDHDVPRLGHAPSTPPQDVHAPHVVGGNAFEFPVGPVRMAGAESLYYGLVTSGEEVVDLYLFTWHKYRGLEWRLQGMTPRKALFLVERVEGLSAVSQAWAFAGAVESALRLTPTLAACRTRAIALELERLYNHVAAIAALCQATGLSVGQANAEIALERLLRVNAAVFGHRYLFGVIDLGGAARAPDLAALRSGLPGAIEELRAVTDRLSTTNSFLDRLEATGILDAEQSSRLGLVGPVARATGVDIDVRAQHPHRPYDVLRPETILRRSGDGFARYEVLVAEIEESVRLLDQLAEDECGASVPSLPAERGVGLGWAESPRGEALAFVRLDEHGRIERARLRPASVRNWRAFDDACRSQNVFTDVPIIEASFWLTVAGTAR